tara:strand:+ start:511 stop:735 length:225 start_codon:yes stop_codon:yes gene_type:complete
MKESKLLEMKNKIESLTNVVQYLVNEINNLRDLSIGTLETIKCMPDYDRAIAFLEEQVKKNKTEKDGIKQQDTK